MFRKHRGLCLALVGFFVFGAAVSAGAHCQIPCGIYDDGTRITLLREHVITIQKSMREIQRLEKEGLQYSNQLIRWVMNKEDHANKFQDIVTQYFMAQRIKLDADKYEQKIGLLHELLVMAMKCKQSTDLGLTQELMDLIHDFEHLYMGSK